MITLREAALATGGEWLAQPYPPDTPLHGGVFDTRTLGGDTGADSGADSGGQDIFFALSGESGDGHDYLHHLAGSNVKLAVVRGLAAGRTGSPKPDGATAQLIAGSAVEPIGGSAIQPFGEYKGAILRTPDPLSALAGMGHFLLEKYQPVVVAVTGSYGKTTAKEVIAHVLAGSRAVLKSPGSLNTEIGVPVTLLDLDGSQDTVVLEFSARKPGDIATLSRIAPPHVALLLAVGKAHLGVFGDLETIFRAKGEIFTHLRPGGLALVGAAQPRLREMAAGHRTLTFGRDGGDLHASGISLDGQGRQSFTAVYGDTSLEMQAGMPGPHGCEPVLAAWAVARELGVPDAIFAERAGVEPGQKGRLQISLAPGGAALIDDCYNASPETVINLIETLNARPERDKVVVLGPLAELEEGLAESARDIAGALRPPLTRCLVYDPVSPLLYERLQAERPQGEVQGVEVIHFDNQEALIAALRELDAPGRVIGIKGARSAHMERFVQAMGGVAVACGIHPCPLLRYCTDCNRLTGI